MSLELLDIMQPVRFIASYNANFYLRSACTLPKKSESRNEELKQRKADIDERLVLSTVQGISLFYAKHLVLHTDTMCFFFSLAVVILRWGYGK